MELVVLNFIVSGEWLCSSAPVEFPIIMSKTNLRIYQIFMCGV